MEPKKESKPVKVADKKKNCNSNTKNNATSNLAPKSVSSAENSSEVIRKEEKRIPKANTRLSGSKSCNYILTTSVQKTSPRFNISSPIGDKKIPNIPDSINESAVKTSYNKASKDPSWIFDMKNLFSSPQDWSIEVWNTTECFPGAKTIIAAVNYAHSRLNLDRKVQRFSKYSAIGERGLSPLANQVPYSLSQKHLERLYAEYENSPQKINESMPNDDMLKVAMRFADANLQFRRNNQINVELRFGKFDKKEDSVADETKEFEYPVKEQGSGSSSDARRELDKSVQSIGKYAVVDKKPLLTPLAKQIPFSLKKKHLDRLEKHLIDAETIANEALPSEALLDVALKSAELHRSAKRRRHTIANTNVGLKQTRIEDGHLPDDISRLKDYEFSDNEGYVRFSLPDLDGSETTNQRVQQEEVTAVDEAYKTQQDGGLVNMSQLGNTGRSDGNISTGLICGHRVSRSEYMFSSSSSVFEEMANQKQYDFDKKVESSKCQTESPVDALKHKSPLRKISLFRNVLNDCLQYIEAPEDWSVKRWNSEDCFPSEKEIRIAPQISDSQLHLNSVNQFYVSHSNINDQNSSLHSNEDEEQSLSTETQKQEMKKTDCSDLSSK